MVQLKRKLYKRGSSYETTIPKPLLFALDLEKNKYDVLFTYDQEKNHWIISFAMASLPKTVSSPKPLADTLSFHEQSSVLQSHEPTATQQKPIKPSSTTKPKSQKQLHS
ncbi:MAG: hypothetical protein QW594_00430 [Candidatus Woesearchaeota archaeon]